MTTSKLTHSREGGYSLIEVMIAMALLGVVTISVFTLFFMGRRNVYSGKQTSQAIAIGTQVIEDLQPLNRAMLFNGAFGVAATSTGDAFTIPPLQPGGLAYAYTGAKIRSTNATIIASPPADIATENTPPGLLARWNTLLGNKLARGSVTVVMTPEEDPTNTPPRFGTAQIIHARVFVRWVENNRPREVVLDTVKAF
jgi:prepilin-type N-terminal cleavage/methylation domain-containing protein